MATASEAAQDMARVLDALTRARRLATSLDEVETARHGDRRSSITTELEHAEKAGERVAAYLHEVAATPLNPRDGGPL